MDKYVLIKQSFYTNYDIIRFDVITLERIINLLKDIDDKNIDELLILMDELYEAIFEKRVKEMILIMKSLVVTDENYNSLNILAGLETIKKSISKKEKLYQKYVNYIDNLH